MTTTNPNYEKTLMYVGLGAAGIFIAYKVFSALRDIGGGGGGGGGTTCPSDTSGPGSLVRLHVSKDAIGTAISNWLKSSSGYAVFQSQNPNFASNTTLNAQGYDDVQWTYEYPVPYTVSGISTYKFYPTFDASIRASYIYSPNYMGQPVTTQASPIPLGPTTLISNLAGNNFLVIPYPDGGTSGLVGKRYGSTLSKAVYGLEYFWPLPLPSGVSPPNPNSGNILKPSIVDPSQFFMFAIISVRSWRIVGPQSVCKGWTLNSPSGTNVVWDL